MNQMEPANRARRVVLWASLALALAVGVGLLQHHWWRQREGAFSEALSRLDSPQLRTRLEAAEYVLGSDPTRLDARLKLAEAHLDMGWFLTARQDLAGVHPDVDTAQGRTTVLLMTRSY